MANSYCFEPNEVFENRNKAYGAYWLRRIYNKRVLTSLAIGVTAFTLGIASPTIITHLDLQKDEEIDLSKVVELTNLENEAEKQEDTPPPIEAPPPPPKVETVRFVPPVVAPDEEVSDEDIPPPQDDLKEVQASTITQEGDPNANPNEIIVEDPVNTQAEVVVGPVAKEPEKEEVFVIVEQQPEFPGGMSALQSFLRDEVNYPEIARKAGVEGRVFVTFVVGNDGAIRDIEVARGIGAGCDEEAIRAIKAMPKWIPGKQRGKAVSVRFSMPIQFKLR